MLRFTRTTTPLPFRFAVSLGSRMMALALLATASLVAAQSNPSGNINTIAGNGVSGYSGDGGPAVSAELGAPQDLAMDSAGNLYVADAPNNVIRKISASTGIITTVVGNGTAGYSGDGGAATNAELNYPDGVALDSAGNIYISDFNNNVVRKVTVATGIIATIIGNGGTEYVGDGGPATSANLAGPSDLKVDSAGNIYVADTFNNAVRKVTVSTGIISTVAGDGDWGPSGDGGPATSAAISNPQYLALDSAGNLYISDWWDAVIRKVTASTGIISTVAGNGTSGYTGDGGPAHQRGNKLDQCGRRPLGQPLHCRFG